MPALPLPENASLEHLKNQAKLVQGLVTDGDDGALDLVVEFHPRVAHRSAVPDPFKRSDAQLTVARLYGFRSWTALRDHLATVGELARPDIADSLAEAAAVDPGGASDSERTVGSNGHDGDRFVTLACVSYGNHDAHARVERGRALLTERPELAGTSLAAMAAAGDHRAVAAELSARPELADEPCGPNRWPPLLYAAYSRIEPDRPDRSTAEVARVLLAAGADPDAGFLWQGLVPPFTALTGAFGRGEQDQPPHPEMGELARLLLDAGADPNDGQTLYNNGLGGTAVDDPTHLELLVAHGLGTPSDGPWYRRLGDRLTPPEELVYDELEVAAHRGLPRRMRFLVGLGLDLERGVGRSGLTPWRLATDQGHAEVLAVLAEAGVDR